MRNATDYEGIPGCPKAESPQINLPPAGMVTLQDVMYCTTGTSVSQVCQTRILEEAGKDKLQWP
jgi:hypothetical protein